RLPTTKIVSSSRPGTVKWIPRTRGANARAVAFPLAMVAIHRAQRPAICLVARAPDNVSAHRKYCKLIVRHKHDGKSQFRSGPAIVGAGTHSRLPNGRVAAACG